MTVKLLTKRHLEFLSLIGGCTGSSESTLVKMPNCWKSHVVAQLLYGSAHVNLVITIYALMHLIDTQAGVYSEA